jgi:hypothetical protein
VMHAMRRSLIRITLHPALQVGEQQPEERRDLAVLLMHAGQLSRAKVEMEAYADATSEGGQSGRSDKFDRLLVGRLLDVLRGLEGLDADVAVTSVQSVSELDVQEAVRRVGTKKVPLTW